MRACLRRYFSRNAMEISNLLHFGFSWVPYADRCANSFDRNNLRNKEQKSAHKTCWALACVLRVARSALHVVCCALRAEVSCQKRVPARSFSHLFQIFFGFDGQIFLSCFQIFLGICTRSFHIFFQIFLGRGPDLFRSFFRSF